MKKSVDFTFADVKSLKSKMKKVQTANERYDQQITELQVKLKEAERYRHRWKLRLHGVPEDNPEDIRAKMINICCALVPNSQNKVTDNIDIVHHLGRIQGTSTDPGQLSSTLPTDLPETC